MRRKVKEEICLKRKDEKIVEVEIIARRDKRQPLKEEKRDFENEES